MQGQSILRPSFWLRLVYPSQCLICGTYVKEGENLVICSGCLAQIRYITRCCSRCGWSYERLQENKEPAYLCGRCQLGGRLYFSKARSVAFYEGVLKELIHHFKYKLHPALGFVLGKMIIQHLPPDLDSSGVDLLLPVPLHPRRLRKRGFNQSATLAKLITEHLGRPLRVGNLVHQRFSPPQVGLSMQERRASVRGAFTVRRPDELAGKRVLLVDDVYTTGATAQECAKQLCAAGAKEVQVLTLARTKLSGLFMKT